MSRRGSLALLVTLTVGCGSPPSRPTAPPSFVIAPVSEDTTRSAESAEAAAPPSPARPSLEAVAGEYESELWSNGELRPGKTKFFPDGTGTYTFLQEQVEYPGMLRDCGLSGLRVTCVWEDDFGAGRVTFTFDDLGREFSGSWSATGGEDDPHPWRGVRAGE